MKADFDHWLTYHGKAYPGFAQWVDKHDDQLDFMRRILGKFTRDELQAATDQLYQLDDQPNGYSNHPRAIRRLIKDCQPVNTAGKSFGPELKDDHLVADCPRCMDYGIVSVLNPLTLKRLRAGDCVGGLSTCYVVCDCEMGNGRRGVRWQDGYCLIRYEPLLDEAIKRAGEFPSVDDAMWHIAREKVRDFDNGRNGHVVSIDSWAVAGMEVTT